MATRVTVLGAVLAILVPWAPTAEKRLSHDLLETAADSVFVAKAIDCRRTTCVASVVFPDYQSARQRFADILRYRQKESNCGVEITLSAPANTEENYATNVIFDCAEVLCCGLASTATAKVAARGS